ncbi:MULTISPECIES: hypothetical protein [unclassified Okeania]|uniref:hypothetical protein n=1 Tax=unclassified Okeania TaxID=2634635 RepID=UPI0013C199D5|nr:MULTISPECIES: hypothetical protein [unclassified Okeania]NEN87631.1 hypothetical protein [Okeania sp. SIO3H1]NET26377.1 hypothetical protein [Okeania sp. SIO1I7]NET43371.1 hypothetical protein [Okeania sp. SIO2B3]
MNMFFPLAPRYRLDDESPWLERIDPTRNYWIHINGEKTLTAVIPGFTVSSTDEFKQNIFQFRDLEPGAHIKIERASETCYIYCISQNCYAVECYFNKSLVWHLFDKETLESLLMTSHPDWKCASSHIELGQQMLARSLQVSTTA